MSLASPTQNLSFLLDHGSALTALIQRVQGKGRRKHQAQKSIDHAKIVEDINQFLVPFRSSGGEGLASSLEGKSVVKVLQKLEDILRQLMKDDPTSESYYKDLVEMLAQRVNDLKQPSLSSVIATFSSVESSRQNQAYPSYNKYYWQKELDFEPLLRQLTDKEKQCLAFCISLFSTVTSAEIKKRDLIQWWIGMDVIDDTLEGDQILKKLVAEEFILQTITIRVTPFSLYTMNASVLSKLKNVEAEDVSLKDYVYEAAQTRRHFIAYHNGMPQVSRGRTKEVAAAINISAYTLNVETFDWLFLMRNVNVVHLGTWRTDMDYVVIEDIIIKFLKAMKNLKQVRFLSFQGVSRIEELPDSVYSLSKLKVLDLRGCGDLRLLSKGIESLQQLTHLDLSKCYQLMHIPKAITLLSKLKVLKGFMINPDGADPRNYPTQSCAFSELPKLKQLRKLSIRTRRMNFPTNQDVQTLQEIMQLRKLKIAWVIRNENHDQQADDDTLASFLMTLKKLELQAAPEITASRLLSLMSHREDNCLEKLYISGGGIMELDAENYYFLHVKVVRLRHLHNLHLSWYDFKHQFPNLTRVEIYGCPNLFFFPCNGNGVWDDLESSS